MREARLTSRDRKLIDLLVETGMNRNLARTLVCISKAEEISSVLIERHTGLRQPEVSLAMQDLRRRGWVSKKDKRKEGKGRPIHLYKLSQSWSDIVDHVSGEQRQKIQGIEENIKRLRSYSE